MSKYYLKLNLSFFDGEKTEKATPRKKSKARDEGQVAKSQEISTAFAFITAFAVLKMSGPYMIKNLREVFYYNSDLLLNTNEIYNVNFTSKYLAYLFSKVLLIVAPMFVASMIVGLISNIIQVGWKITTKPLMPKLSKLNPIKGFKRIFSLKSIVELVKSISKMTIIGLIVFNTVKAELAGFTLFFDMEIMQIFSTIGLLMVQIGLNVGAAYMFIAVFDYVYVKWKHEKDLRMSKQDIKEEYKMTEGNPQVKGKIKQKMREVSMRRMMQDLPTADVIITNPTHFAVAIKYDRLKSSAPIVIAKGADHLAKKIREIGKENDIELVENKPLARTLYSTVEIGKEIPPELYQSVAEVLAYVYNLKNKT